MYVHCVYKPATRLLEKRREMAEVDQALFAQKEVGMICVLNLIMERRLQFH
jgi:hypothetical protein